MTTEQQEVQAWLDGGRNYQQGVMLLARYCKNKVMVHTLMKPGKERFGGREKLEYELTKAVGINLRTGAVSSAPIAKKPAMPVISFAPGFDAAGDFDIHVPLITTTPALAYPAAIRRLKLEYGEMYNRRAFLHRKMREVPAENSPENMEKRAEFLVQITSISSRMEVLYAAEEKWVRMGTIPDEKELWPEPPPAVTNELPNDIESLKKLKKNLQTNNVKDRNLLAFQGRTKGDDAQPMPDGPKRKLIEKRLQEREEMILKVELKLQECYLNHQK